MKSAGPWSQQGLSLLLMMKQIRDDSIKLGLLEVYFKIHVIIHSIAAFALEYFFKNVIYDGKHVGDTVE